MEYTFQRIDTDFSNCEFFLLLFVLFIVPHHLMEWGGARQTTREIAVAGEARWISQNTFKS